MGWSIYFQYRISYPGPSLIWCSMSLHNSLFATVLFVTVLKCFCAFETIFITTNSSDHECPAEPCLTLQEFVAHHHGIESNTVLKFLPGEHILLFPSSKYIFTMNTVNITLTGVSNQHNSIIHCMSEFSMFAISVQNLTISNLYFSGCGGPILDEVYDSSNELRSTTLFLLFVSDASILHTHVYNSKGAGLLAVDTFDLILYRASFVRNIPNSVILFKMIVAPAKLHTFSYIVDSEFAYGKSDITYYGGGLSLAFYQTPYTVYVNLFNVALHNNTGIAFGNFVMTINEWSYKYTMVRAEKIRCINNLRPSQSGFSVRELPSSKYVSPHQENHSQQFEYTLHVLDSYFDASMDHIAVYAASAYKESSNLRVKFTDTTIFYSNHKEVFGSIFEIFNVSLVIMERMIVTDSSIAHISAINSKVIIHNTFILRNRGGWGVATLLKSKVAFLGDTVFAHNYGVFGAGAIYAYSSTLILGGNVEFVDNTGYDGGALALYAGSEIVIGRFAHLKFIGNHAKHFGGAIYVDNANHQVFSTFVLISCFYKLADTFNTSVIPHILIENNTADYAGSALYGGWIDFCTTERQRDKLFTGPDFDSLFQVNGRELDSSIIASNSLHVCLCIDSRPGCSITQYNISAYPGTTIQIPAVAVGQRFGTVPSTVRSDYLHELTESDGIQPNIQDWQHTQKVEKSCTTLTYTIMSPSQVKLIMKVEVENLDTSDLSTMQANGEFNFQNKSQDPDLYFTNLLIHIEMLLCPLGFEYDNKSMTCECDSKLVEYGINCSIDTQTIRRKTSLWITTAKGGVIVHDHCQFDYCKPESFDLNLKDPDEQCAFNRFGILCGACQYNLSHVFGTSACRECSSLWALLWVPVIALAGIALVVLLIVLNLTVSMGTINGLIFYANIVRANHATFFPPNTSNSFLSWFIAWINLDLGIETCFYNGLDAYVKTWLQFVFPLYIWFLVITIIVLSHYFTLAARLSGRNAVQVLATLFLLSYAKLLQIIITIFQSTDFEYPDNSVKKVWLYDGNVDYLQGKHIPLFIAAMLLLLISLPYTAVLIFIQYLQHWSSYRVLFWVKKLKPLFDAYTGPYKDRHRYWTGLLLLVRIVLFLIFSLNTHGNADINILTISLTVLSLLVYLAATGGVYKTWALNIIEYSFFLNLGVLASATLYTIINGQGQIVVAYTSVSIAFTLFVIIVVFHILIKLKSTQQYNWISVNIVRKAQVTLSKLTSALRKLCCNQKNPHQNTQPRVTHATIELRESLLEYCSQ